MGILEALRDAGRARGRCPSGSPTAASSSLEAPSGRAAPRPRGSGLAPFSAMQPVLSPIARIAATSSLAEPLLGRQRGQLGALRPRSGGPPRPPPGSGSARRTRPPGGRGSTGRRAGSGSARPARRSAAAAPASPAPPRSSRRAGRSGGRSAASSMPGPQVAPEEAAVVDDAGQHLDLVAGGGVEAELARPGLERVEDHHRPVDPVAEALQAGDQVEGEAVGGPGATPIRAVRPASRSAAIPSQTASLE